MPQRFAYSRAVIEARHLRVLRAVATTGSFSAAARELGCTQPAVSQQMKALESSAGTPLLVRTGREMRLTQAGEALVRHASGILAGLTAAEEEIAAIAGLRAGRVRLVSFPSGSSTLVPTALAALRAAHPGTRVSLVEAEPPRSVEMLRDGDCDVALAFRYGGSTPRSGTTWSCARCWSTGWSDWFPRGTALAGRRRPSPSGTWPASRGSRAARAAAGSWWRSARRPGSPRASTSRRTTTRR